MRTGADVLRVGLTGGLGSGKSTAAKMFVEHGAYVLSADELGRNLMQPAEPVYAAIVAHFGNAVVTADGSLDRGALARIAFTDGRVEELNAIVHPAVIAQQAQLVDAIAAEDATAVVVVESALIFETKHVDRGMASRFDKIILVRASEALKIARFIARSSPQGAPGEAALASLREEARQRLTRQIGDDDKALWCDYVLTNDESLDSLRAQVATLWLVLKAEAATNAAVTADLAQVIK